MDEQGDERGDGATQRPAGVFGVDEAGRGPALGSMFAAAVVATPDAIPDGVDDSKRLSAARREELAAALRSSSVVAVGVASVPPARIDDPDTDMNGLTVAAQAAALGAAVEKSSLSTAGLAGVVDACDTDADRFGRRVAARAPDGLDVCAEHGADAAHPAVAAASVVAKVERDAHVAALAEGYGELGSGYPSDPATRSFLRDYVREHGDLPACARRSWRTCRDALAAAEQSALGEF